MKAVQRCRPQLSGCVVEAVRRVRTRTGSLRHLLRVIAYMVMYLAHQEGLLSWRPKYQSLYRTFNMSRYLRRRELGHIVSRMLADDDDGEDDDDDDGERRMIPVRHCSVSVTPITISPPKPKRH